MNILKELKIEKEVIEKEETEKNKCIKISNLHNIEIICVKRRFLGNHDGNILHYCTFTRLDSCNLYSYKINGI